MQMKKLILSAVALAGIACGGSGSGNITPPGARKEDPFITVRVRHLMDTTTAAGRAQWHVYVDITSADPSQAGLVTFGNISIEDVRLRHTVVCAGVAADSIGQRFVALLGVADTTTSALTADASAKVVAEGWFNGNHVAPSGWMALYLPPTDAWTSAQFDAGHGRVASDPIKWGWDWTGTGATTFYERASTDTDLCNTF